MRQLAGRPALLALVGGLVAARLAWHPGRAIYRQMTAAGCLLGLLARQLAAGLAPIQFLPRDADGGEGDGKTSPTHGDPSVPTVVQRLRHNNTASPKSRRATGVGALGTDPG
jgi:hypothetical protein